MTSGAVGQRREHCRKARPAELVPRRQHSELSSARAEHSVLRQLCQEVPALAW